MSTEQLGAARARLIEVDLLAYEAPLYQVLALPQGPPYMPTPHGTAPSPPCAAPPPCSTSRMTQPVSIGQLLNELERRRDRL